MKNKTKFSTAQMKVVARTIANLKRKISFDTKDPCQVEFFANLELDLVQSMGGKQKEFIEQCMPDGNQRFSLDSLFDSDFQTMVNKLSARMAPETEVSWVKLKGEIDDIKVKEDYDEDYDEDYIDWDDIDEDNGD